MITGVMNYQDNTLVVNFPCGAYDLSSHLGSIGIRVPAAAITINATSPIEVKLVGDEPIGELVLSKLSDTDTLSGLNLACQEIAKACPYGYGEFSDMLLPNKNTEYDRYHFYKQYETLPPSTDTGIKYLIKEVQRYQSTMENYRNACVAAEDEEYAELNDDEWDR